MPLLHRLAALHKRMDIYSFGSLKVSDGHLNTF